MASEHSLGQGHGTGTGRDGGAAGDGDGDRVGYVPAMPPYAWDALQIMLDWPSRRGSRLQLLQRALFHLMIEYGRLSLYYDRARDFEALVTIQTPLVMACHAEREGHVPTEAVDYLMEQAMAQMAELAERRAEASRAEAQRAGSE